MCYVKDLLIINVIISNINKFVKDVKKFIFLNKIRLVITYLSNDLKIVYQNKEIIIL